VLLKLSQKSPNVNRKNLSDNIIIQISEDIEEKIKKEEIEKISILLEKKCKS
jgi:hypothetical protein